MAQRIQATDEEGHPTEQLIATVFRANDAAVKVCLDAPEEPDDA
jgi:hypothetical protein